jgi:restriction endonuclease Mrr
MIIAQKMNRFKELVLILSAKQAFTSDRVRIDHTHIRRQILIRSAEKLNDQTQVEDVHLKASIDFDWLIVARGPVEFWTSPSFSDAELSLHGREAFSILTGVVEVTQLAKEASSGIVNPKALWLEIAMNVLQTMMKEVN